MRCALVIVRTANEVYMGLGRPGGRKVATRIGTRYRTVNTWTRDRDPRNVLALPQSSARWPGSRGI